MAGVFECKWRGVLLRAGCFCKWRGPSCPCQDIKLATIGPATAAALGKFHLRTDVQPSEFRAERLVESLKPHANNAQFLLIRASRGRDLLADELAKAGGEVTEVVAYESRDAEIGDVELLENLDAGIVDWITVTSSAIATSLAKSLGERMRKAKIASISPVTSETIRSLGFQVAVEANEYTMDGLSRAIVEFQQGSGT